MSDATTAMVITLTVVATLTVVGSFALGFRRRWFHPLALPLAYLALVLTAPILYVVNTDRAFIFLKRRSLEWELPVAVMLLIAGTILGVVGGLRLGRRYAVKPRAEPPDSQLQLLRRGARVVLIGIAAINLAKAASRLGTPYGQDQFDYTFGSPFFVAAGLLALPAALVIGVANTRLKGKPFERLDLVIVVGFALVTLASGDRDPIIPLAIGFAWLYEVAIRRIKLRNLLLAGLAIVVAFSFVALARSTRPGGPGRPVIERVIGDISTPSDLTHRLTRLLPESAGWYAGSTYVASVKYLLPSPIARPLFGDPDDTGTFVFRELAGITNPSSGVGFATLAEAYLNFSLPGTFFVPLLFGSLLGWSWVQASASLSRAWNLLYATLIATLPLGFRTDALGHVKAVLYAQLGLAGALWLVRGRVREVRKSAPVPEPVETG